jgi:hypothetical protein
MMPRLALIVSQGEALTELADGAVAGGDAEIYVVSTSTEVSRSSAVAPSLMFNIGRAAGTDVSYQESMALHVVQDGLVYSTSGLL